MEHIPPPLSAEAFSHYCFDLAREELQFRELRKAVSAVSAVYVQGRGRRLQAGDALNKRGKRWAFAAYYGPLHYMMMEALLERLELEDDSKSVFELGCGTAAAAIALCHRAGVSKIEGIDSNDFAIKIGRRVSKHFGLDPQLRVKNATKVDYPKHHSTFIASFTLNEFPEALRERWIQQALLASQRGQTVLILEPLSTRAVPWWAQTAKHLEAHGFYENAWKIPCKLPSPLQDLSKAAKLNAQVLKFRSLSTLAPLC